MTNEYLSMLSPYKDEKIGKTISEMVARDIDDYCSVMETRGLWFATGLVCITSLSLLKGGVVFFKNLSKKKFNPRNITVNKENVNNKNAIYSHTIEIREKHDSLDDKYCTNRIAKEQKAKALNALRLHLYMNNLKLKGTILKVIQHKLSEFDLLECARTGNITKPFSTTQITFGNEVNSLLAQIFPSYVMIKNKKFTKDTYITVEADDYGFLQEKLIRIYQEEGIRVIFD